MPLTPITWDCNKNALRVKLYNVLISRLLTNFKTYTT